MTIFYRNLVLSRPELVALLSQVEGPDREIFDSIINFLDSLSCFKPEIKNFSISLCRLNVLCLQKEVDRLIGFDSPETVAHLRESLIDIDFEVKKYYKNIFSAIMAAKNKLQKENYFMLCATIKLATEYALFYLNEEE